MTKYSEEHHQLLIDTTSQLKEKDEHKKQDILYVKEKLGHRQLNSTLIYTHLVQFKSKEYTVKTAKTLDEACELAKAGFSYFTKIEDVQIFRKPK